MCHFPKCNQTQNITDVLCLVTYTMAHGVCQNVEMVGLLCDSITLSTLSLVSLSIVNSFHTLSRLASVQAGRRGQDQLTILSANLKGSTHQFNASFRYMPYNPHMHSICILGVGGVLYMQVHGRAGSYHNRAILPNVIYYKWLAYSNFCLL